MIEHPQILPAQHSYIRPYAQPALGGRLGLTSRDIAHSLHWNHFDVLKALSKRGYADVLLSVGCNLRTTVLKTGRRGRPQRIWVLDSNAAKIFLAQTRTPRGVDFVMHLLRREQFADRAEAAVPRMIEEIARLRAENDALRRPRVTRRKRRLFVDVLQYIARIPMLIGGGVHLEPVWERKPYDELTLPELQTYRIRHRAATMRGLALVQDADLNPARLLEAAP